MENMDFFKDTVHGEDNRDLALKDNPTNMDLLDYMVIVLVRHLSGTVAFKGGYMLNKLLKGYSRLTHDVDFSVDKKEDYESVKNVLREIAEEFQSRGIIERYQIKDEITETSSGGIDMYGADGAKVLGIDVGLHNINYGVGHYDIEITELDAFEIERMLADKIIAILSKKRFRRTKDLYDVYAIANAFTFNFQKLSNYIVRRGGALWDNIPFSEEILIQYKHAWDKLVLIGVNASITLEKPPFEMVLDRFYAIVLPIKHKVPGLEEWYHGTWR